MGIKKKVKFEIGKKYVVKMKDEKSVELLREHTSRENVMFNIKNYLSNTFKVVVVIVSVCIPPLLLITIPLIIRGNRC